MAHFPDMCGGQIISFPQNQGRVTHAGRVIDASSDNGYFGMTGPRTIIAKGPHGNGKTALNKVGLYISSSTPPDPSIVRKLEDLGIDRIFVENDAAICDSYKARLTHCMWHNTYLGTKKDIAIISQVSPLGAIFAGPRGLPLVSSAATTPGGFNALTTNWELYERKAKQAGHSSALENWSLVTPMHLANTRRRAQTEVADNLPNWLAKHPELNNLTKKYNDPIDALVGSGFAVIGSPRDAKKQIERLRAETSGFGNLLLLLHDWAEPEDTYRSLELCMEAAGNYIGLQK